MLPLPQSIKRVLDRRTVDLFSMFNEELNLVKREFGRHTPPDLPLSQPWYAGRATWARILKRRIDVPMKVREFTTQSTRDPECPKAPLFFICTSSPLFRTLESKFVPPEMRPPL